MILIVDDLPLNRFSLEKVLLKNGFEVDTAASGEEALQKVLRNNYILIILDVQMPEMDGFEVAAHLSGLDRMKNTAIVFMSAHSIDADFITKGYKYGAADYITKPVDMDILLHRVSTLYKLYQARALTEAQQKEINQLYNRECELNQSLRESTAKLLEAQRIARMGNWEYDPTIRKLTLSPEIFQVLGIPEKETVNVIYLLKQMPESDRRSALDFWRINPGGTEFEFVHQFGKGANTKYLKQYGKVEYSEGRPVKITGILQDVTNEKLKDAEIVEAYRRYELVNLATNDLIWDWDLNTNKFHCNDNITRIYGYPKESVGETIEWWQNLIHPDDAQRLLTVFVETAQRKQHNCECEYRIRCADGTERDVFNQAYCVYNNSGELIQIVCSVKDVTDLKRAQKELMNTELKLIQTVESINEGFFACSRDWKITYWNRVSESMFGLTKEEAINKNLWELFPEARKTKFFEQYSKCLLDQKPYSFEEYYRPLDRWYRVNVHPSGNGIAVYFEDITDELLKGLELGNSRVQAEIVDKTTWDIVWEWNFQTHKVKTNKNFSTHFGYSAGQSEFSIRWWKQRIHPEDRRTVVQSMLNAVKSGQDTWNREYRFSDSSGNYHFVRDRAIFFRDEKNQPFKITGSMSDIQELKEIQSRMQEIAFSNSHVVRKPLANILGLIELIEDRDKIEPELLRMIKESSMELDDVIKKITDISH